MCLASMWLHVNCPVLSPSDVSIYTYETHLKWNKRGSFFKYTFIGEEIYSELTEEIILEKMKTEIGEVPDLDERLVQFLSNLE